MTKTIGGAVMQEAEYKPIRILSVDGSAIYRAMHRRQSSYTDIPPFLQFDNYIITHKSKKCKTFLVIFQYFCKYFSFSFAIMTKYNFL
jgi:hypothetical protein